MKIIIGLGNPGEKYKLNRHNIGFEIVNAIGEKYGRTTWIKKFNGSYCKCSWENQNFLILKPETFMNESGRSVRSITSFYKLEASDIIVIHDDLDLPIGQIKFKISGGHAGHNGLKSIHQTIGDQYIRIRIGIGRPKEKNQISSYVLSNFNSSENNLMEAYKKYFQCGIGDLLHSDYKNFIEFVKIKMTTDLGSLETKNNSSVVKTVLNESLDDNISDKKNFKLLKALLKKFN